MDGTLGIRDSRKSSVSLVIIDYTKAEDVYDRFYEELQKMNTCSAEGKTGTSWMAYGKDRETATEITIQMNNQLYGLFSINISKKIP